VEKKEDNSPQKKFENEFSKKTKCQRKSLETKKSTNPSQNHQKFECHPFFLVEKSKILPLHIMN